MSSRISVLFPLVAVLLLAASPAKSDELADYWEKYANGVVAKYDELYSIHDARLQDAGRTISRGDAEARRLKEYWSRYIGETR